MGVIPGWNKGLKSPKEWRDKISKSLTGIKRPPFSKEWKQKLSEAQKRRFSINPCTNKGRVHTLETRLKISLAKKGKPLSDKNLRGILKANCARPNKFEVRALAYLEIIYPGRFSYSGDGACLIGHKSADAIDTKTRTVVQFNGTYWHLKRFGLEVNDNNKRYREVIEAKPFIKAGYKVLFIWEDELVKLEDL